MPAAVILVVPLALLGTVAAVAIRGMDNNIYTQIGIVLIIALASKNAILIVEFARELRAQGPADPRGGRRGVAAAVPADPDDLVRVHPGDLPAGQRHRRRRRQPPGAGHGRLRRHDRRDGPGRLLRPGLLRPDATAQRVPVPAGTDASPRVGPGLRAARGSGTLINGLRLQGPDPHVEHRQMLNRIPCFLRGTPQVIALLQIEPEFATGAKEMPPAARRYRRYIEVF